MTKRDLELKYKQITGVYPPDYEDINISDSVEKYILWLEEQVVSDTDTIEELKSEIITLKANRV